MTGNTDLEVKFVPKQREMLQKFRVSLKISWEPGSLVPGEYPALQRGKIIWPRYLTAIKTDPV